MTAPKSFRTLDDLDVSGKRVLVRMDLNVPMHAGNVTDTTRVVRLLPTLKELLRKKAKIIVLSHLGRPGGKYVPDLTLAPLVDALAETLRLDLKKEVPIRFGVDCVGPEARNAVAALGEGEILLLENLRFHAGEEENDPAFAKALAEHGDMYIDDAFACAHRPHASIVGIPKYLPSAAGRLMEEELSNLEAFFTSPVRPLTAIVGGAKVSTKLELLENLIAKADNIIIGGAMAHTFLLASGKSKSVGKSLVERNMEGKAKEIIALAKKKGCVIHLPIDVIEERPQADGAAFGTASVEAISDTGIVYDAGNKTLEAITQCLEVSHTVIWNGPIGVFEKRFAFSTLWLAREIARLTETSKGTFRSIAGGGETVEAINAAGMMEQFTYVSTAGGAFLEWLEGKTLPGVAALQNEKTDNQERKRL